MALTKTTNRMTQGAVYNILDYIPASEHAAIKNRTSTYDCSADIQALFDLIDGTDPAPNGTGGTVHFPKGTYNIGSTTIKMRYWIHVKGDGQNVSEIKGTSSVFSLGSEGPVNNCSFNDIRLFTSSATDPVILLEGYLTQVTGSFNAFNVDFDGDQAIQANSANFYYAGNILIDHCAFRKQLHLTHTQGLINTFKITNCLFNTTGTAPSGYMVILGDPTGSHPTGFNQTYMGQSYFEVASNGGIQLCGGDTHQLESIWFFDETGPTTAIDILEDAAFVSLRNIFARPAGGSSIKARGNGPLIIENTNLILDNVIPAYTSSLLPRVSQTFSTKTGPLLYTFNHDKNGDIYLSSRKPAGVQALTVTIPATTGTNVAAVPVPSSYDKTLFNRIIGVTFRMGSAGTTDPGASYTWGIRLRDQAGNLSSWTNANTAVAAFEQVDVDISGVMAGTDYLDWIDTALNTALYIDIIKAGAGATLNQMEATVYIM